MKIQSIQKVIKVGDSLAVTIPAKDARALGIQAGDSVLSSYQPVQSPEQHTEEVVAITQKLIKRHKKALKNLSQR